MAAAMPQAPGTVEVNVTISHLRSDKGVIRACMTSNPRGFPNCRSKSGTSYRLSVPARPDTTLHFIDVKPGTYAIALLHDENDNGRADRVLLVLPKEGFGFSRNAPLDMGPPKFASAAFHVGDKNLTEHIRMRYLF